MCGDFAHMRVVYVLYDIKKMTFATPKLLITHA
jgi:hypothetical protein